MFSHISFASIPVVDLERARDFWRDKMGLTVAVDASYGESRWIMLEIPGANTRLHLDKVAAMPAADEPALPLIAPDVVGTITSLRRQGVEVTTEPRPAEWDPGTTYAMVRDSEGNLILIASH
ncbi:MAG TPA: VOC family protein [Paracoccaceae bacterium]|nr:VOC family protein [Paracoccaceae bacterium]